MDIERKKDLSIYYWLEDLFSDASYVNIEDGYPTEDLEVTTYFHEAGYDYNGEYYEKSWEFEPWGDVIDDEDREPDI